MKRRVTVLAGVICALVFGGPSLAQGGRGGSGDRSGGADRSGAGSRPGGGVRSGGGDRSGPGNRSASPDRSGRGNRTGNEREGRTTPGRGPDGRGEGGSEPSPKLRRDRSPATLRHKDHDGDGRPDRHRPRRPRVWWPYWNSYGLAPLGYDNPFYESSSEPVRKLGLSDNIVLRIQPENARITVNGLLYSSKGKASFDLPVGAWTIEISAPGYRSETITLNVEQGVQYKIERRLERDPTRDKQGNPLKEVDLPSRP